MDIETERSRFLLRQERWELRVRIGAEPGSIEHRRTLAESYRTSGNLDQAGRWGFLVPGWTTREERQLFARMVTRTGPVSVGRVRRLLLLPAGVSVGDHDPDGLFDEFPELLVREEPAPEHSGWTGAAMTFTVLALLALLFASPLILIVALVDAWSGGPQTVARVSALAFALLLVLALLCAGVGTLRTRRRRPGS